VKFSGVPEHGARGTPISQRASGYRFEALLDVGMWVPTLSNKTDASIVLEEMDAKSVEEALALFERHPTVTVLALMVLAATWAIKTDALGFVSRRKRQRRADVFDTLEKFKAAGTLTDEDLASLQMELREAGEGHLSRPAPAGDHAKEVSQGEPQILLPPMANAVGRVADAVLKVFVGLIVLGLLGSMVFLFVGCVWAVVASGDPSMIFAGALFGPMALIGVAHFSGSLVRDLAKKFPRRLAFAVEGMDWLKRRTELVRGLGMLGFVAVLHLALVAMGAFITYEIAVESESALGLIGALFVGAVTAAIAVKGVVEALAFLGVVGTDCGAVSVESEAAGS